MNYGRESKDYVFLERTQLQCHSRGALLHHFRSADWLRGRRSHELARWKQKGIPVQAHLIVDFSEEGECLWGFGLGWPSS